MRAEKFLLTIPEFAGTVEEGVERQLWDWLFIRRREEDDGHPTVRNVLFAEDAEGRSVAHYGIEEITYRIDRQCLRGGTVCRLAIDEKYRGETLFMDLTVRLLHGYPAHGLSFVQGLANREGMREFHLAFGFNEIGDVPIFVKPVRLATIARETLPHWAFLAGWPFLRIAEIAFRGWMRMRISASRGAGSVQVERLGRFDRDLLSPDPSTFLEGRYRYFADRSPDSLRWRFFESPSRDYRFYAIRGPRGLFLGYFVLRPMPLKAFRSLTIVDLCFDFRDRDVCRAVFREVDRVALEENVDLCAMMAGSSEVEGILRRELYLKSPESFTFVVHERGNDLGLAKSRKQDWYVSWFDHDFV